MKHILDSVAFSKAWFLSGITVVMLPLILFATSRSAEAHGESAFALFPWLSDPRDHDSESAEMEFLKCSFLWGCRISEEPVDDSTSHIPVVVYVMTVLLYWGIVVHGCRNPEETVGEGARTTIAMLSISAYMTVGLLLFIGSVEGLVSFEGEVYDEEGWFGQLGVLYCLTMALWSIFAAVFTIAVHRKRSSCCFDTLDTVDDYKLHMEPSKNVYVPRKQPNQPRRMGRSISMPGKVAFGKASTQRFTRYRNPTPFMSRLRSILNVGDAPSECEEKDSTDSSVYLEEQKNERRGGKSGTDDVDQCSTISYDDALVELETALYKSRVSSEEVSVGSNNSVHVSVTRPPFAEERQ